MVLGKEKIKERIETLFKEGTYDESKIDRASYSLRIDNVEIIVNGVYYTLEHPYADAVIKLPPRQISILSTKEVFTLPKDISARVGISFKYTSRGLIALFGPQVDPEYHGKFYAAIYNASYEEVPLKVGAPVFKVEFCEVDIPRDVEFGPKNYTELPSDMVSNLLEITQKNFSKDLKDALDGLESKYDDVKELRNRLEGIESAYKNITLFGVYLLSITLLGIIFSFFLQLFDKSIHTNWSFLILLITALVYPIVLIVLILKFFSPNQAGLKDG